jgi:hypothetical protein
LGIHPKDKRKFLRFCNHHEIKKRKKDVEWYNHKGQKRTVKCYMNLPVAAPSCPTDKPLKVNKGRGADRSLLRQASQAREEVNKGNKDAQEVLVIQQVVEHSDKNESEDYCCDDDSHNNLIAETVKDILGLNEPQKKKN